MIILKITIALLIAAEVYLLFDCLFGGKKQKPVQKKNGLTFDEKKKEVLSKDKSIEIAGRKIPIRPGKGNW